MSLFCNQHNGLVCIVLFNGNNNNNSDNEIHIICAKIGVSNMSLIELQGKKVSVKSISF